MSSTGQCAHVSNRDESGVTVCVQPVCCKLSSQCLWRYLGTHACMPALSCPITHCPTRPLAPELRCAASQQGTTRYTLVYRRVVKSGCAGLSRLPQCCTLAASWRLPRRLRRGRLARTGSRSAFSLARRRRSHTCSYRLVALQAKLKASERATTAAEARAIAEEWLEVQNDVKRLLHDKDHFLLGASCAHSSLTPGLRKVGASSACVLACLLVPGLRACAACPAASDSRLQRSTGVQGVDVCLRRARLALCKRLKQDKLMASWDCDRTVAADKPTSRCRWSDLSMRRAGP